MRSARACCVGLAWLACLAASTTLAQDSDMVVSGEPGRGDKAVSDMKREGVPWLDVAEIAQLLWRAGDNPRTSWQRRGVRSGEIPNALAYAGWRQ